MPFIINFDLWKVEIKPEQQERADALKQKYHGKVIQNREELIKVQNDLNNELTELTGKGIPKSNYKYGQNVLTQMFGNVNTLIACAATPEEKNKWEALLNEINDAVANGHAITTAAEEEAALQIDIVSDGFSTQHINCYSEGAEKKVEDIIKKINAAAREGLKNAPIPGEGNDNDAFRRNALEIMLGFSEAALNGSLMEELAKTDDFFAANSIGAVIPSIGQYGVGLKPDSAPYMSDYARFDHLVPLQTPVNKALHLMNGNIDYRKKGSKVSKDDELRIREQILIEGADGLYAVDKIRKNMVNEKVKASFPNEVNGAYTDSIGDRGQFIKWGEIHRARRGLVLNGWAMSDITAIGSLAALFPTAELNRENLAKNWEDYNNALPEYERKLAEYNTKLREYEEKAARGERIPKPFKPLIHGKPDSPLYSAEEDEALRQLKEKMDAAVNTAPGNEERRKELINSIIDGIDHLPEQTKKRFPPLTAIREDLKRAAERELTAAEKEILEDQAALKRIADAHPVREYTEAEQQKDLAWLSEIEEKDKELNDIFKTDPYAHDKIREMQALSAANPNLISEGVKKVIGAEAWNAYAARAGRESDELKAIDILTHPDSPHNVSRNHKLLSDVETAVRERIIDIPKKNLSNIGMTEFSAVIMRLDNVIPSISPEYDTRKVINDIFSNLGQEKAFDRQNEYIERLNKVLDSPGNLNSAQQRNEIAACLMGLLGPLSAEVSTYEQNGELFRKENLSPEEKKAIEKSYTRLFDIRGGLLSTAYAEKVMPILKLADRAFDRAEKLMMADGHVATAVNIKPVQTMLKNILNGTTTMKIQAMDPVVKIGDANLNAPTALHIDRDKVPLNPGTTRKFSFEEVEEKAEVFPIHKAINAEYEIKSIWGEYLSERQKGPLSPEREREYWNRIDSCYKTAETVIDDLIEKQNADPSFADNNMRTMFGQGTAKDSFEDAISGPRGMKYALKYVKGRRDAVNNGWPLSELGFYSHMETLVNNIDAHIQAVESGGDLTKDYVKELKEFRSLLNDRVFNKPYEKDPIKRADLYADIAQRINVIEGEEKRLKAIEGISLKLKEEIDYVTGPLNNVNSITDDGGMPYEYEAKLCEKEARIEAVEKAKGELEGIKDIADPIVYNELKSLADKSSAPKQDFMVIDDTFVEKADLYLNGPVGSLKREIETVRAGKETTLEAKTGISHEAAVDRIWNMLNASDSFFHFDSKQYKAVKAGLQKLHNGIATEDDKQKLSEDVKTYLTDPKYDRINKHSKNGFDNTRFNIMFTLANELDPAWAKKNFSDMNIAALHGEKAANTSFHNVHEYTNFMHRQMADGGFLSGTGPIASQHWYLRTDSYGQKGLVEEVLRIRNDSAISEFDKLEAEKDNLNRLSGDAGNMTADNAFKAKFQILNSYRQEIAQLADWGSRMDESRFAHFKRQLIGTRVQAINQIKNYLNDTKNRNNPLYDKAALAYGVLDPKGAHEFIIELNKRKIKSLSGIDDVMGQAAFSAPETKIKPVNLVELEKKEGLDLGGRKALNKKRIEVQEQKKVRRPNHSN